MYDAIIKAGTANLIVQVVALMVMVALTCMLKRFENRSLPLKIIFGVCIGVSFWLLVYVLFIIAGLAYFIWLNNYQI